MINKTEWNRMMEGKLYNPYKVGDLSLIHIYSVKFILEDEGPGIEDDVKSRIFEETKETIRNMFDPAFYAYSYPDVAHAYGITDLSLIHI